VVTVEEEEDDGEIVVASGTAGVAAPEEALDTSKCLDCGKVYKHANCLLKHRWEHSVYWKVRFLGLLVSDRWMIH
jgi:hypothetical protein